MNLISDSLNVSPASNGFGQCQFVFLDVSSNFGLSDGSAFQLSANFGNQFLTVPSLSSAILGGSAYIQGDPRTGPVLLAANKAIDGSLATKQALFTVPDDRGCIIDTIILHDPSDSLATLSVAFGFNAGADDVVATAVHAGLTGGGLAKKISPITAAYAVGVGGDVFGIIATVQQAATVFADVLGYYYFSNPE